GPDGANAYQETIAAEVDGLIDRAHFERALQWLTARHEALRIAIDAEGHHQEIRPDVVVDAQFADLRHEDDRETALRARLDAEAQVPFDLAAAPLFRARVWTLAADNSFVALYS